MLLRLSALPVLASFCLMLVGCDESSSSSVRAQTPASQTTSTSAKIVEGDWPNFRGPSHDGISAESGWSSEWGDDGPKKLWSKEIGTGFSSVSVADGRLYTMGHKPGHKPAKIGDDSVWCFDAETGELIWQHTYKCKIVDNLHEGGPATTPTVDDGRVFTISKQGHMFALDVSNGDVLWKANLSERLGVAMPSWGFSCSPLVLGDKLIVEAGRTVALDKKTGETIWQTDKFYPGYGSPVAFEHDGKTLLSVLNNDFLMVLASDDGEILAKFPWETSYKTNATTPIVAGDTIFVSTAYNKGCALFDFDGSKLRPRYDHRDMRNHMANCVLYDGHLYGFDGKSHNRRLVKLVCMDYATGKVKWAERGLGCGSLMMANGKLIILSDQGELVVAPATPDGFTPTSRAQVIEGRCWSVPVLAGGRIYCRTAKGDLVAVDVRSR